METLFDKYLNVQLFAIEYRGLVLTNGEKFHDYETFKNEIHKHEYIMHKFKKDLKNIDIYLFKEDSKYITSTIFFKKILDRYNKFNDIIMITKSELNVYRKKMILQYKELSVKNYLFKHFIIEINRGPLCSKHTILSPEEVRVVSYNIMAHGHKLPAIFDTDPQCIWIGGEINDLIKIESYSEITGKTINYRIVTPSSGKTIQNPKAIIKKVELEPGEILVKEQGDEIEGEEDYVDDYIESDNEIEVE